MAERKPVAKRVYTYEGGEKGRSARGNVVGLTFEFSNGHELEISQEDFNNLSDSVKMAAAWHGLSQKLGDTFSSAKGDADKAADAAEAMWERLQSGEFTAEREGPGPRISMLAQAIYNAKTNAGQEADLESIAAKLRPSDDTDAAKEAAKKVREGATANPVIAAEMESLKAEAARARAEKAAAKAKEAAESDESLSEF